MNTQQCKEQQSEHQGEHHNKVKLERRRYYLTQETSDKLDALAEHNNTTPSKMLEALIKALD